MLPMTSALLLAALAISAAVSAPEVSATEAALLAQDDECTASGDAEACALNALQHRSTRHKGVAVVAADGAAASAARGRTRKASPKGSRDSGDKHELNLLDRNDYREDAASFLEEALRKQVQAQSRPAYGAGDLSDLELTDTSPMCDLTPMSYAEVISKWNQFHQEWMGKLPPDAPAGTRRIFNDQIREAFPEILFQGNPVVVKGATKELGWDTDAWEQAKLAERLGNLEFLEMGFGYPAWLGDSLKIGTGASSDGTPLTTSFTEYFKKNRSKDDIFLFLNEEDTTEEPRLFWDDENEAARRVRDLMTPTPPFAYPSKTRLMLFAIDGRGSSHGFHEHTAVWQMQVKGYKMWHFMPPSTPFSLGAHVRGGTPLVKGKPFAHPNGCSFLKKVPMPPSALKCLAAPGDMVIMPANWVHSTCGLTEFTAGAGGWLHAETRNRDEPPRRFLESILAEINERSQRKLWDEVVDVGLHTLSDEENERKAGLSPNLAELDRRLHPADFDDTIGRVA